MKVLVITPQYFPDTGPSAPIYTDLCEDLAKEGYEVKVVCGFPHNTGSVWPEFRGRLVQREEIKGVDVTRVYVHGERKELGARLLYHISFNVASSLAALAISKPSIVIADGPFLWSGLPLVARSLIAGVPFIYVVHDIYPDVAVRLGVLTNRWLIRMVDTVERFFCSRSAAVSVLADGMKANLVKKGVPAGKIAVIPPCIDTEFIRPLPRENRFRPEWGLDDRFVVLYSGNIGLAQGLENVLRMALLLQAYPDIAIAFVGDGNAKEELQAMAKGMDLKNTFFLPIQRREDVPEVFGLGDVSLVSLNLSLSDEAVPSKTFSIMASGRAMVAIVPEGSAVAQLVERSGCGIRVIPGDPQQAADAVLRLYHEGALRMAMGLNGRKYVVRYFSRPVSTGFYKDLIEKYANAQ